VLYGWLLDKNGHRCEPLTDLSYPVVLLQRGESRGDRFIESLRSDLYGVLNVSDILYRNCTRSKNHVQKRSIFAFCSLVEADRYHCIGDAREIHSPAPVQNLMLTFNSTLKQNNDREPKENAGNGDQGVATTGQTVTT
jgi:hypothetical protein